MRRPLTDMSAQFVPLIEGLLERAVLTGLLVHRLGVKSFEQWSLLLATVTILSMLDLGAQITFSNRMTAAANAGDFKLAGRIYRESNMIFLLLSVLITAGTMLFAFSLPVQHLLGFAEGLSGTERTVLLLLGMAQAFRLVMSNSYGVYRANLEFARGTMTLSVGEMVRVSAAAITVLFVPTLVAAALAMFVATVIGFVLLIPLDISRRFPEFRYGVAWPTSVTLDRAVSDSILYASNFLPTIVLTQLPILIIGGHARTGILAVFVLMRTVSNLIRTFVQRFAAVIGMELARLEVKGRRGEAQALYDQSSHFAAYLFGLMIACALVWGGQVVKVWTGSAELFDPILLAIMLAPLVLTPRAQIAAPFITYSNRPARLALAVGTQTALAVVLAIMLPIDNVALRLTVAIFGAELIALPPILFPSASKALGLRVVMPALLDGLRALGLGAIVFVAGKGMRAQWPGFWGMIGSLTVLGLCSTPLLYLSARSLIDRARRLRAPVVDG